MEDTRITSTEDFITRWSNTYRRAFHVAHPSVFDSIRTKEFLSDVVWAISRHMRSWEGRLEDWPFFPGMLAATQWVESIDPEDTTSPASADALGTMMWLCDIVSGMDKERYDPQSLSLMTRRVVERKSIVNDALIGPFVGVYGIDTIDTEEQALYVMYAVFGKEALFLSPRSALIVIDMMRDYGVRGVCFNRRNFDEAYISPSHSSELYILRRHPHVLGLLFAMSMTPQTVDDFEELVFDCEDDEYPQQSDIDKREHILSMGENIRQQQPGLSANSPVSSFFDVASTAKHLLRTIDVDGLEAALEDSSSNDVTTCSAYTMPSLCLWQFGGVGMNASISEQLAHQYSLKAMTPHHGDDGDDASRLPGSNVLAFHRKDDDSLVAVSPVSMSFYYRQKMCLLLPVKKASETSYHDVMPEGLYFLRPNSSTENMDDDVFDRNDELSGTRRAHYYLRNVVSDNVVCSPSRVTFV